MDVGHRGTVESVAGMCEALLTVPIFVRGHVYGGIVVYDEESRAFSDDDLDLAIVFGDQVALAIESARLREHLKEAAAAAERSRLARDLHDSVTQALFSASLVAEVLPQVWQRDPDEAQQGLQELGHLTRGALAEMRTMLLELRPHALLETKLDDLLWQLTEAITSRAELLVSFEIEPIPALPPDVHVTFYRVSQEALHNVVKHAEASHVTVGLRASPPIEGQRASDWQGQVILHIRDDGGGFDTDDTAPGRLGLSIMRERAEAVGAMLSIKSNPGRGTQITLVWRST
jgi:signal transduction histidine kinase